MTSIITAVFKATIGLLVNKGRDAAAEKLKEGDITDQKFRGLIVREIQDLKSKLEGLSRKDLLTAVDFFEAGLRYLYKSIHVKCSGEASLDTPGALRENFEEVSLPSDAVKTVSLAKGIRNLQLAELDETAKSALSEAKERFKMAREKATEASNNEALSTFDRITGIRYRVMATMLESALDMVGTTRDLSALSVKSALENALPECEQCILKLHSLPAVQNSFKVEFRKGLNLIGRFGKDERMEIISTVCQINRAIYDAMKTVGKDAYVFVDTGEDKVDPLRDVRVTKALRKVGMEHCCVTPWSFGQEGEENHKLKDPVGITTNAHGQFVIADNGDKTVKVFDSSGNFFRNFNLQADDGETRLDVLDVACDVDNTNTYVLVGLENKMEVQVYDDTADLHYKFPIKVPRHLIDWGRVTVSESRVVVLTTHPASINKEIAMVTMYEHDGGNVSRFINCFVYAQDISASNDGRLFVMYRNGILVKLLTVEGKQVSMFIIDKIKGHAYKRIASHLTGEHMVVAGIEEATDRLQRIAIYTYDGKLVGSIQLNEENGLRGIAVTKEGRIAVAVRDKVVVFFS